MPFPKRYIPEPTLKRQQKTADQVNVDCARIILADPEKYPGIMQECAARWVDQAIEMKQNVENVERVKVRERVTRRAAQGELFAEVA